MLLSNMYEFPGHSRIEEDKQTVQFGLDFFSGYKDRSTVVPFPTIYMVAVELYRRAAVAVQMEEQRARCVAEEAERTAAGEVDRFSVEALSHQRVERAFPSMAETGAAAWTLGMEALWAPFDQQDLGDGQAVGGMDVAEDEGMGPFEQEWVDFGTDTGDDAFELEISDGIMEAALANPDFVAEWAAASYLGGEGQATEVGRATAVDWLAHGRRGEQ